MLSDLSPSSVELGDSHQPVMTSLLLTTSRLSCHAVSPTAAGLGYESLPCLQELLSCGMLVSGEVDWVQVELVNGGAQWLL